ncbi:hypothetical protein DL96DRAFT_913157 [Flagelloscypha sp. PMI_526]|nr:hypothetical protein DL96DRAFT_913157 [Flagelloscypha sp. PMI_526]
MLPDPGKHTGSLPALKVLELDISLDPAVKHLFATGTSHRDHAIRVMRYISTLYRGSKTLKQISLSGFVAEPDVLDIVLPRKVKFPQLEELSFSSSDNIPTSWTSHLSDVVLAHTPTLKVLCLQVESFDLVQQLLDIDLPDLEYLEVKVMDWFLNLESLASLLSLSSWTTALLRRTLRSLSQPILEGNSDQMHETLLMLGQSLPHLEKLEIYIDTFTLSTLHTIAASFPNLSSLHLSASMVGGPGTVDNKYESFIKRLKHDDTSMSTQIRPCKAHRNLGQAFFDSGDFTI